MHTQRHFFLFVFTAVLPSDPGGGEQYFPAAAHGMSGGVRMMRGGSYWGAGECDMEQTGGGWWCQYRREGILWK